jgi:hypothetical protein
LLPSFFYYAFPIPHFYQKLSKGVTDTEVRQENGNRWNYGAAWIKQPLAAAFAPHVTGHRYRQRLDREIQGQHSSKSDIPNGYLSKVFHLISLDSPAI